MLIDDIKKARGKAVRVSAKNAQQAGKEKNGDKAHYANVIAKRKASEAKIDAFGKELINKVPNNFGPYTKSDAYPQRFTHGFHRKTNGGFVRESFKEFITELSTKTLKSYVDKAQKSSDDVGARITASDPMKGRPFKKKDLKSYVNRNVGMDRAKDKIASRGDPEGFTFKDKFKKFFGGK